MCDRVDGRRPIRRPRAVLRSIADSLARPDQKLVSWVLVRESDTWPPMELQQDIEHEDLLDDLYLAAVRPDSWSRVLERLAEKFDAELGLLVVEDLTLDHPRWWAATPRHADQLRDLWLVRHRVNAWLLAARGRPVPSVARTESLVPLTQLRQTDFYRDCLEPAGLLHSLGANLFAEGPVFAYLSLMRGPERGPFDDRALVRAGWVIGHLARAIRMQIEITSRQSETNAMLGVLGALDQPIVLLGNEQVITFVNPAAHRLLAERDGLRVEGEHLCADRRDDQDRLAMILAQPPRGAGPGSEWTAVVSRSSGRPPITCRVGALGSSLLVHGRPTTHVVVAHDTALRPTLLEESARLAFGLTLSEVKIASLLLQGYSITRMATTLGVSPNTVKTHISHLLSKTGTSRQPELVAQLLSFATPATPLALSELSTSIS